MSKPLILAMLLLAGCAATPPATGNARGGMIDMRLHYPNEVVMAVADRHCGQFGRRARITSVRTVDAHDVLFECS